MLFQPEKIREILRKAGSTDLINYSELVLRMVVGLSLVCAADISKTEIFFQILGWFMLITSLILMLLPRTWHHIFPLRSAEVIKPYYFQLISPFSFVFGAVLIYSAV